MKYMYIYMKMYIKLHDEYIYEYNRYMYIYI